MQYFIDKDRADAHTVCKGMCCAITGPLNSDGDYHLLASSSAITLIPLKSKVFPIPTKGWKFTDFFCGIGVWTFILALLGGTLNCAIDHDLAPLMGFKILHESTEYFKPEKLVQADICDQSKWESYRAPVFAASPPCQPFTNAGLLLRPLDPKVRKLQAIYFHVCPPCPLCHYA